MARPLTNTLTLVLAATALSLAVPCARGESLEHRLEFHESDLTFESTESGDVLRLKGCDITREPGMPELPVLPLTLALPPDARVTGVEIVSAESAELLGRYSPRPAQPPRILPVPGVDLPVPEAAPRDPGVYSGRTPYPESLVELEASGRLGASDMVALRVHPVQFLPATGKLRLFKSISLRIEYDQPGRPEARRRSGPLTEVADLLSDNTASRPSSDGAATAGRLLEPGDYEHVVLIPNSGFAAAMQPLVDWKTMKGVPSRTVSSSWVTATYPGEDDASKIRSFMADARDAWGATWFLIAGDTELIPTRSAYAMTSEAGGHPEEDALGCDLYYSDLDGDWDADGDGVYGELSDAVDLFPDVFVGRAPIVTVEDADAFAAKVVDYERTPQPGFALDMLMAGEVLWQDPFTDSGIGLNWIDRDFIPPRYDPINKLYETLGNESAASVTAALNDGTGHFLHCGHAWINVMGCGDGYLYRWEIPGLTNAHAQPLVYSIGCWAAAFDLDEACIAERFLQNPAGGAVAFVGNSSYGWGSPGNPGYGYSDRFMQEFYRVLFTESVTSAGAALAAAKARFIPFSQAENVYRWHQYQLNLLGDPEMPLWTDEPSALSVSHADSVVPGAHVLDVLVRSSGGPVEGALVCATNGSDVYERARTSSDGSAALTVDTVLPDSVRITVTAQDFLPYESAVPVVFSGAFLRAVSLSIDDSSGGNGDGLPGPGEIVEVSLEVVNFGNGAAQTVEASLSSSDPMVEVLDGPSFYGDIGGGMSATGSSSFSISLGPDCPDGHVVALDVDIVSEVPRSVWTGSVSMTVAAPVLVAEDHAIDDAWGGDGDGVAEPGEDVRLMVELGNSGGADAYDPLVTLVSEDPEVVVTGGAASPSTICAGETTNVVFHLSLSGELQSPAFPQLTIEAATSDGQTCSASLRISVGSRGFAFDFEGDSSGWTHGGTLDSWHLTDHRSHSGTTSWYVGAEETWLYADASQEWLVSPEFVRGPEAELSFWCWYEFPIYHEDGFYVEVLKAGSSVDTLDFIGSGGALDLLGSIGNDWLEYRYTLPGETGDTLAVRFFFRSDEADVAEGVYVDDVTVTSTALPSETGADSPAVGETQLFLHQNRPNPFSPETSIGFTLTAEAEVELTVYNIQGRRIRTLVAGTRRAGDHEVHWNGTDEFGVDVAAGVYLYRLRHGELEETRKMILVR